MFKTYKNLDIGFWTLEDDVARYISLFIHKLSALDCHYRQISWGNIIIFSADNFRRHNVLHALKGNYAIFLNIL